MIYLSDSRQFFYSTLLDSYSLKHGFGTKVLGDGRKPAYLKEYLQTNDIDYTHLILPQQTHSTNVQVVTSDNLVDKVVNIPDCDGIVTRMKNVVLTCITADCVPIIYFDPQTQLIGISHQGWKGTSHKLPHYMIEAMVAQGSLAKDIRCSFGPAINVCCYHMNLYKDNLDTLQDSGVQKEHIELFPFCTCCDEERFYSYRRDKGIKGEMMHFVMLG